MLSLMEEDVDVLLQKDWAGGDNYDSPNLRLRHFNGGDTLQAAVVGGVPWQELSIHQVLSDCGSRSWLRKHYMLLSEYMLSKPMRAFIHDRQAYFPYIVGVTTRLRSLDTPAQSMCLDREHDD